MSTTRYEEKMNEVYPFLSQSERKVAQFVDQHMADVLRMTSRELKDAIGVSEPTIFRFCKAMGYSGIRDFKISMAEQISSYNQSFFHTEEQNRESGSRNALGLIHNVLGEEIRVIQQTLQFLDYEKLEQAARMLLGAQHILLFGVGTSFEICNDAQHKLNRVGLPAWAFNEFHNATFLLSNLKSNDLVFAISHSGMTAEVGKVLKIATKQGVLTLLMTSYPNTPMCENATLVLRSHSQEPVVHRTAMSSRISQHALFDALYMVLVCYMGVEEAVGLMQQTDEVIYNQKS